MSVEILAEAIRNKRELKGIQNTEGKLSQYADDTTLILDGTEESVRASLLLIEAKEWENRGLVDRFLNEIAT